MLSALPFTEPDSWLEAETDRARWAETDRAR